jgi:hypothetical protein
VTAGDDLLVELALARLRAEVGPGHDRGEQLQGVLLAQVLPGPWFVVLQRTFFRH